MIAAESEVVCEGDTLELTAEQTDYYVWASQPTDSALDAQQGQRRVEVSPTVTTTYYLLGPSGGVADSMRVEVERFPRLRVVAEPEVVDFDNPVLTLEERGEEVAVSTWSFSDGERAEGRKVRHVYNVSSMDSVRVTATGCTRHGCCSDTMLAFAVELSVVWFPNVFTPGSEDENACFRLYTRNVNPYYEHFHIYIYNRFGQLVYESSDPTFAWDGTMDDGSVCPQGTYTYICRYRKPGAYTVAKLHGSITLVR